MNPFDRIVLDEPPLHLTVEDLLARGRAKVRLRRRMTVATAAFAVGAAAIAVPAALDSRTGPDRLPTEQGMLASTAPVFEGASQSAADARRDDVLPAVASLSFEDRVSVILEAEAPEGVWALSRMPGAPAALGDPAGRYGVDWVARQEYGELLLLDRTARRIIRAYPLPGVPPQTLLLRDDAVYCARQGDGGLPDSMLCRVDRDRLTAQVRVFPPAGPDPASPVQRRDWQRDPSAATGLLQALVPCGKLACAEGPSGASAIDPVSLALTARTDPA